MPSCTDSNIQKETDTLLVRLCDYVCQEQVFSDLAFETAHYCLMDTLGCGVLALNYPECTKLLGPVVPNVDVPQGVRVPGTSYRLDPVQAAWNIGAMIRWLDFNDTWLAAEWGHPSDNLGGLLAVCDYISLSRIQQGRESLTVKDLLTAMIKAHEIQGCLALKNAFNRVGLDHVILVKIATTAVVAQLLGCDKQQIINAMSLAFVDGHSLRTYRHAPNTGSRKSWAAGDATSRGVFLALLAKKGEMGYPNVLSTPKWGFQDVLLQGREIILEQPLGCYVMENILFKIAFPAEFHAQTAVECALQLHQRHADQLDQLSHIQVTTHESAIRIISKTGPLNNPADRDHCLQYMIACALLDGELTADSYEDKRGSDPRIDQLRDLMHIEEEEQYSRDYLDSEKRSIANAIQLTFNNGEISEKIEVHYPLGHKRRREEGIPLLEKKFVKNLQTKYNGEQLQRLCSLMNNQQTTQEMPVDVFVSNWVV